MKFKRSDVGLYIALGMVGAGVGLIVGGFIASRRSKPYEVLDEPEIEIGDEEEPVATEQVMIEMGVNKNTPSRILREPSKEIEYSPELKEAIEEYELNSIQVQMILSGAATMEEVIRVAAVRKAAEKAEPYTYAALYKMEDGKPELDDLVPDIQLDLIDDRFEILEMPADDSIFENMIEVYYDPRVGHMDWSFFSGRGNLVKEPSVERWISQGCWDIVLSDMDEKGLPVWVRDHSVGDIVYRFEFLAGTTGDLTDDEDD